jgi:GAF domain-containing protein
MFNRNDDLELSLRGLLEGETDITANSANFSALLFHSLAQLNWVGFYWLKSGELVLGAFQGKPACVRIPLGKGVCGTAALTQETQIVPDVHAFPGHITCDADSRSELVIPILNKGLIVGVLDIDSPIPNRFDDATVSLVSKLARIWTDHQFSA